MALLSKFQIPGGRIDLGIDVRASNHRARLKGINGWMNMDDYVGNMF